MVLVIDDDPRRIEGFRKAFGRIHDATSLASAIGCLASCTKWSAIYLDHDGVDGDLIAECMARHKLHRSAKIVIHSSNYTGAVQMHDTLKEAGYDVEMKSFGEIVGDDVQMGGGNEFSG